MEALAIALLAACTVVTGLYALLAGCVATCCLVAVGTLLVRQVGRDAVETARYDR